jgi:hypothetical protein
MDLNHLCETKQEEYIRAIKYSVLRLQTYIISRQSKHIEKKNYY